VVFAALLNVHRHADGCVPARRALVAAGGMRALRRSACVRYLARTLIVRFLGMSIPPRVRLEGDQSGRAFDADDRRGAAATRGSSSQFVRLREVEKNKTVYGRGTPLSLLPSQNLTNPVSAPTMDRPLRRLSLTGTAQKCR